MDNLEIFVTVMVLYLLAHAVLLVGSYLYKLFKEVKNLK